MRALSGLDPDTIKAMVSVFRKKYPFLEIRVEEIEGTESYQRFVLQMQAGTAKGWDATFIPIDFYKVISPFRRSSIFWEWPRAGFCKFVPR